jgi:hypothetical protein
MTEAPLGLGRLVRVGAGGGLALPARSVPGYSVVGVARAGIVQNSLPVLLCRRVLRLATVPVPKRAGKPLLSTPRTASRRVLPAGATTGAGLRDLPRRCRKRSRPIAWHLSPATGCPGLATGKCIHGLVRAVHQELGPYRVFPFC